MNNIAYTLSTFGSRFNVILDPEEKSIEHGTMGMFFGRKSELVVGVEAEGIDGSYLPFSQKSNNFQKVYMSTTMNTVTYHGINKFGGYDLIMTLTSPFIPENKKINTAPLLYINVKIKRNTRPHNLVKVKKNIGKGELILGLHGNGLECEQSDDRLKYRYKINTASRFVLGDFARNIKLNLMINKKNIQELECTEIIATKAEHIFRDGCFCIPFNLDEQELYEFDFVWGTYLADEFMVVNGESCRMLYTNYFKSIDDVIDYGLNERENIIEKSKFFDSVFETSSLSRNWKDFIAFTFQSYKMNTLYVVDNKGKETFSVWEGNCMYNLTLDVEYNNGLFYYTLYPSLLPGLLDLWSRTEKGTGFIAHDLGHGFGLSNKSNYSHPMQIEENCNFILMTYAYNQIFNKDELINQLYPTMKKLIDFMIKSDTTGNGIPNEGTSNTIDDAIPAIQHAKEQTYLAVKSACAFQAFAVFADKMNDIEYKERALKQSKKIMETVDSELWLGDHYAVCLDKKQDGYTRFFTREPLSGDMEGRNAYSIFAENGLLYLFMADFKPDIFNYDRFKENIYNSYKKCLTIYGCNHSDEGSDSIWISQNLWRDFIAAYLGYDMLDNVDMYWEFQKVMNSNGEKKLYIDTFGENALWYYPRGLTSIGVIYAMLRLRINNKEKKIYINPLRNTMEIPLTMFADWENLKVPKVLVKQGNIIIQNEELLKGWEIIY